MDFGELGFAFSQVEAFGPEPGPSPPCAVPRSLSGQARRTPDGRVLQLGGRRKGRPGSAELGAGFTRGSLALGEGGPAKGRGRRSSGWSRGNLPRSPAPPCPHLSLICPSMPPPSPLRPPSMLPPPFPRSLPPSLSGFFCPPPSMLPRRRSAGISRADRAAQPRARARRTELGDLGVAASLGLQKRKAKKPWPLDKQVFVTAAL